MLRIAAVLLIALLLAGVLVLSRSKAEVEPIEFEIPALAKGQTVIDEGDILLRTGAYNFNLIARSRTKETVTVKVRLGKGSTEGTSVFLSSADPIRPTDRQSMTLSVGLPFRLGPIYARIVLYADELPGWSYEYEFKCTKIDKLVKGKYLSLEPSGIDLGSVRVGQTKKFKFELVNFADQPLQIERIRPRDGKSVKMSSSVEGLVLGPGKRYEVDGEALIRSQGTQYGSRIDVHSDADNAKVLIVNLSATVRPDYDLAPAQLPIRSAYASQQHEYSIKIRGAEGIDPFVVGAVNGLDPLFELSQPLSTEAAIEQVVSLRIRKDALTGPELLRGALSISIEPAHVTLKWPYALRVLPPVNAQPAILNFGTVQRTSLDKPLEKTVRIVAIPGRSFKVTAARAQQGHVHARVADHMIGTPWEILVSLPALADKGVYRDQILIETDDPDVPRILVPVRAVVR